LHGLLAKPPADHRTRRTPMNSAMWVY